MQQKEYVMKSHVGFFHRQSTSQDLFTEFIWMILTIFT